MMGLSQTCRAVSARRQREFQEFPPDVFLLCLKIQILRVVSRYRLSFYHLNKSKTFSFCVVTDFHKVIKIFACYKSKTLRRLKEQVRKELYSLEANSAFPLASALPSLTFCFLTLTPVWDMIECVNGYQCVHVCVCILCCLWCKCTECRLGCVKGCC